VVRKLGRDGAAAALVGRVVLAPAASDRGIAAQLGEDGRLVVLGVEAMPVDESLEAPQVNERVDTATSELILDAPLVVRVEVGAVSMTAREWAALVPGDVIAVGRRVSEPVVLRVGGVEVARGELVDIEGELGVRIGERGGAA
jgi:type III secretion protein Q